MRLVRFAGAAALLLVCSGVAGAAPIQKGASILAIQLNEGVADLYFGTGAGYITAFSHSEIGVQAQYWHLMTDDLALALTGGIGWFSEKDEPGSSSPAGSTDFKYTQSSWQVRAGVDHVAHITDKFHLFVGPGIQFWSGKAKTEGGAGPVPAGKVESKNVNRIGIEGRIGVHMKMSDNFGGFLQIGHYIAHAGVEDGGKATWWPSGHDGAGGIAFNF